VRPPSKALKIFLDCKVLISVSLSERRKEDMALIPPVYLDCVVAIGVLNGDIFRHG